MVWNDTRTTADKAGEPTGHAALTSGDAGEDGAGGRPARFLVLGMLTVADGRDSVALQPSRPAALLAALLLHANSVVSAEYLQRVIWGERSPAQGKSALHSCVLRLRRLFGKYGIAGNSIEAVSGGYRLIADAETLDLVEFRELLAGAYSDPDPESELRMLRAALALWQPPLLANVHSELLHRDELPRLTEEWLRAVERVYDLELARGRHREALAEIAATARSHPLHERFTEQLMEALRRAGRRAEALSEYRRTKVRLAQQLGVDPGPALQRLELEILRGTPSGRAALPPGTPGPAAGGSRTPDGSWTAGGSRTPDGPWTADVARTGDPSRARDPCAAGGLSTDPGTDPGAGPAAGDGAGPGAGTGPAADDTPVTGERVLDRLVRAGLLEEGPRGHYRMHELLKAFARAAAAEGVGARSRTAHARHTPTHLHPTEA